MIEWNKNGNGNGTTLGMHRILSCPSCANVLNESGECSLCASTKNHQRIVEVNDNFDMLLLRLSVLTLIAIFIMWVIFFTG